MQRGEERRKRREKTFMYPQPREKENENRWNPYRERKSRKNKTIVTRERKERVAYNIYKSKNDDGGYLPNDITMKQTRVGVFLCKK